jgi:hypothetical protein
MSCDIFAEDREVRSFSLSVLDAEQFEDIKGVNRRSTYTTIAKRKGT